MTTDMIGVEIKPDDIVVSFNSLYKVLEVYKNGMVRVFLLDASRTTRPIRKNSKDVLVVNSEAVTLWLLKK